MAPLSKGPHFPHKLVGKSIYFMVLLLREKTSDDFLVLRVRVTKLLTGREAWMSLEQMRVEVY